MAVTDLETAVVRASKPFPSCLLFPHLKTVVGYDAGNELSVWLYALLLFLGERRNVGKVKWASCRALHLDEIVPRGDSDGIRSMSLVIRRWP